MTTTTTTDGPADGGGTEMSQEPTRTDPQASAPGLTDPTTPEADAPSPDASAVTSPASPTPNIPPRPQQTLAGRVWIAIGFAALLLVLLIIFIAENTKSITISFLGMHGHISEALALLIAIVVGIIITLLVGTARILQLRLEVAKSRRELKKFS